MLNLPNLDNNSLGVITIRFNNTDFLWVYAIDPRVSIFAMFSIGMIEKATEDLLEWL